MTLAPEEKQLGKRPRLAHRGTEERAEVLSSRPCLPLLDAAGPTRPFSRFKGGLQLLSARGFAIKERASKRASEQDGAICNQDVLTWQKQRVSEPHQMSLPRPQALRERSKRPLTLRTFMQPCTVREPPEAKSASSKRELHVSSGLATNVFRLVAKPSTQAGAPPPPHCRT